MKRRRRRRSPSAPGGVDMSKSGEGGDPGSGIDDEEPM